MQTWQISSDLNKRGDGIINIIERCACKSYFFCCVPAFLSRPAEVPAIAKFTARIRYLLLRISNHSGFSFGRKIVCLIFLKADIYLKLPERTSNASFLRRKLRCLNGFLFFLPDSYNPAVKLKVKHKFTLSETVILKTYKEVLIWEIKLKQPFCLPL